MNLGLDTTPVVVPLREYGKEHHRTLPSLPQSPQLASSPSARLLMSWWDREVNFWRIPKRTSTVSDVDGQGHRLVGKVLFQVCFIPSPSRKLFHMGSYNLQGEENLSSAALSADGKLLVAATNAQVKLFTVTRRKGDDQYALRFHKLDLPPQISKHGAKVVSISPDNQWICMVRPNNDIYLARILETSASKEGVEIAPKLIKLHRVSRYARSENLLHGTLGNYARNIRCVEFSQNSRILVCGDLAGCIDTWLVEDAQEPVKTNGKATSEDTDDDDDDDSSGDDDDVSPVLYGKRWIRPTSDHPIPRLAAGILLFSFRPSSSSLPPPETPQTEDLASSEPPNIPAVSDRLVVLTADHQLLEFNALEGKLSDWSRRNPKTYLPHDFTLVKDRAMGLIWDIQPSRERLWLYGPSWVWMFDLSQDFPSADGGNEKNTISKATPNKRKRIEDGDINKFNTGAGDRMPLAESDIGLSRKMRKIVGADESNTQWVTLDKSKDPRNPTDEEEELQFHDSSAAANDAALAKIRRGKTRRGSREDEDRNGNEEKESTSKKALSNGTGNTKSFVAVVVNKQPNKLSASEEETDKQVGKPIDNTEEATTAEDVPRKNPGWWHTYKYREILGVVPLGHDEVDVEGKSAHLEVAVIERPMWDVDLPGRYIRDYE